MRISFNRLLILFLLTSSWHSAQAARKTGEQPLPELSSHYVYLAPNVIQKSQAVVFTSFAVTNTTPYWFNVRIYLVSTEGDIVQERTPLLKGYGTWQQSSGDFIGEDFQGSIWIISPHPLIGVSMNYQLIGNGELAHLATVRFENVEGEEELSPPQYSLVE